MNKSFSFAFLCCFLAVYSGMAAAAGLSPDGYFPRFRVDDLPVRYDAVNDALSAEVSDRSASLTVNPSAPPLAVHLSNFSLNAVIDGQGQFSAGRFAASFAYNGETSAFEGQVAKLEFQPIEQVLSLLVRLDYNADNDPFSFGPALGIVLANFSAGIPGFDADFALTAERADVFTVPLPAAWILFAAGLGLLPRRSRRA